MKPATELDDEELDSWDTRSQDPWDATVFLICPCGTRFARIKRNQLYCAKKCRKHAEYLAHCARLKERLSQV